VKLNEDYRVLYKLVSALTQIAYDMSDSHRAFILVEYLADITDAIKRNDWFSVRGDIKDVIRFVNF